MNKKTQLLPLEALTVAYFHFVKGYPQHDLAAMFSVNSGRVSEACTAIRHAVKIPSRIEE